MLDELADERTVERLASRDEGRRLLRIEVPERRTDERHAIGDAEFRGRFLGRCDVALGVIDSGDADGRIRRRQQERHRAVPAGHIEDVRAVLEVREAAEHPAVLFLFEVEFDARVERVRRVGVGPLILAGDHFVAECRGIVRLVVPRLIFISFEIIEGDISPDDLFRDDFRGDVVIVVQELPQDAEFVLLVARAERRVNVRVPLRSNRVVGVGRDVCAAGFLERPILEPSALA